MWIQRQVGVLLALAAAVVGCGSPPPDVGPTAPADTLTTETFAPPAPEPTSTESPQPPEREISVSLPTPPIGGSPGEPVGDHQCVGVNWLGPDIPAAIRVEGLRFAFSPAEGFDVSHAPCTETSVSFLPSCLDRGFAFTSDRTACQLAVAWTPLAPVEPAYGGDLRLASASVVCPAGQEAGCAAFVNQVEEQVAEGADVTIELAPKPAANATADEDEGPDPSPSEPTDQPTDGPTGNPEETSSEDASIDGGQG